MSTSPERDHQERGPGMWGSGAPRLALSAAGLDPSGGAGIIADVRTFDACGAYGMAVVTTVTYQSTRGLEGRHDLSPLVVRRQLEAICSDAVPDAVKTGALGIAETAEEVASFIEQKRLSPLVVDPVAASGGGEPLLAEEGFEVLARRFLPLAALVTPNVDELSMLCGFEVFDIDDVKAAAFRLVEMGAGAVLVTGVRVDDRGRAAAADVLLDGTDFEVFTRPWVEGAVVHGTGCVLSAAITAFLAIGSDLRSAVARGRELVGAAMESPVRPGTGAPCANPFAIHFPH